MIFFRMLLFVILVPAFLLLGCAVLATYQWELAIPDGTSDAQCVAIIFGAFFCSGVVVSR